MKSFTHAILQVAIAITATQRAFAWPFSSKTLQLRDDAPYMSSPGLESCDCNEAMTCFVDFTGWDGPACTGNSVAGCIGLGESVGTDVQSVSWVTEQYCCDTYIYSFYVALENDLDITGTTFWAINNTCLDLGSQATSLTVDQTVFI